MSAVPELDAPIVLSGLWKVAPATDDLLRTGVGLDVDDDEWDELPVPGHWIDSPRFASTDGPLLYRRAFETGRPRDGERRWVVLDGVFYQSDVWLDGAYLGDTEGYFAPHAFDITVLSQLDTEHVLAVGVNCPPQRDKRAKRTITGVFQHWDCIDPEYNPGGIWRDVRIESTGPVRIEAFRVLCRDANEARANLRLHAKLDSDTERTVRLATVVDGTVVRTQERAVNAGINSFEWDIDVDEPRLWWPWSLGTPHLTDVRIDVECDGVASHSHQVRTGLREIALQDWVLSVNGERLFLKGANLAPARASLGSATAEEIRRDIELARDAGLDLVRVHGHISRPELYAAADELGVLIWQDFPLQWGYARQVRRQAVEQAERAVDLLGHHPSIAMWCAHNAPFRQDLGGTEKGDTTKAFARLFVGQQLPSWNKTVLDRWVKRALERSDETRPAIAHSGVLPHLPQIEGTDSHLYFGWYHGDERDLPSFASRLPRLVRFVSEFGAQSIPQSDEFIEPSKWPLLDFEHLEASHGMQRHIFEERVAPSAFGTFDEWRTATQLYQADVVKHHVEALRRIKYSPTGGFCVFMLNDSMPMVSWSLLDHNRVPKRAYNALVDACRPVIVTLDRPPIAVKPGEAISLDVHVVSDLRASLENAVVTVVAESAHERKEWRWEGDIGADECCRVGRVSMGAPFGEGPLVFDLTLECGDVVATNRYSTHVIS